MKFIRKGLWNIMIEIQNIIDKYKLEKEYYLCVEDLLNNEDVLSMSEFCQHGNTSTLDHSLEVSFRSYKLSKKLGLDYTSAARGGLLHDFFLYDWHDTKEEQRPHGIKHPKAALINANKRFLLNKVEKDIIVKHMWPLTIIPPKYKESWIVSYVDTVCSLEETVSYKLRMISFRRLISMLGINKNI